MKPEDIHLNDWQRIFFGDVPGGFYPEVVFRIAAIYVILMVSMRLMGKRMASQLGRNEMVSMVSLAAAIGIPLQSPERGILPAFVIAIVVILIQQVIAWLATRNQRLESITQGDVTILVADGYMKLEEMQSTGITRERIFSQLRNNRIRHLGEVKRLYFEAGGSFTLIQETSAKPGLGVLPECDREFAEQIYTPEQVLVCKKCGNTVDDADKCGNCGSDEKVNGVS